MIMKLASMTGLSPLIVKLIMTGLVIGGFLFGLRLWGNAQWYKGESKGRENLAKEVLKARQEEWAKVSKVIEEGTKANEEQKATIDNLRQQLSRDSLSLAQNLKKGLAAIQAGREHDYSAIANVSNTELPNAIRAILTDLESKPGSGPSPAPQ